MATHIDRSFRDEITKRANSSFQGDPKTDFDGWVEHWFKTAEAYRDEFNEQGLIKTAQYVQVFVIDQDRKYYPKADR